jgi:biopolymer transport protein ExbD
VINADGGVEHRRVMQVVDRLRGVGLSKLAFGASPLEAGGGS